MVLQSSNGSQPDPVRPVRSREARERPPPRRRRRLDLEVPAVLADEACSLAIFGSPDNAAWAGRSLVVILTNGLSADVQIADSLYDENRCLDMCSAPSESARLDVAGASRPGSDPR
jgi:hypothetical protein